MNILFDLDGTLADPIEAFRASLYFAFDKYFLTRPSEEQMRRAIGPPLHLSVHEVMGAPKELSAQVLAAYREHHSREALAGYRLYPGCREALSRLRARHKLFVATSKPHVQARPVLKALGVDQYFLAIHGSEMDGVRSQKDELIAYVVRENRLDPAQTVMIGDRFYDIRGGRANGVKTVGVLWGYGSRAELEEAGADRIAESFADLDFQ